QLAAIDDKERIAFVYSPAVENVKNAFYFLERFRDPKSTFIYQVGSKIAIVGFKEDVKKLITLCDNVWEESEEKITKVVATSKFSADELTKILKSYFGN